MLITKNWKIYRTIDEAISLWNKRIEKRADKLFVQARKNRLKKENENKKTRKLFVEWKLNITKLYQYV